MQSQATARAFDFDRQWHQVYKVINDERISHALDVAMTVHCIGKDCKWDPENGPWYYSTNKSYHKGIPTRESADWYRCIGACHSQSIWCGVIGERLFADLEWRIALGTNHSAAIGLKKRRVALIIDNQRRFSAAARVSPSEMAIQAAELIISEIAPDGNLKSLSVADRLSDLEVIANGTTRRAAG